MENITMHPGLILLLFGFLVLVVAVLLYKINKLEKTIIVAAQVASTQRGKNGCLMTEINKQLKDLNKRLKDDEKESHPQWPSH